ncbi:unnamed protein product [Thelazia callipaeda]|uniref:TM2 domain-containing protein n=1 Tax=Thelazia callipaeda TaxID=103827 RepID=A0A0N5D1C5_THECL|nr:unnamed protein product [Thelazia callipaeda]
MGIQNTGRDGKFDIFWARLLLMFGGPLGLHLVYLREPLEAYMYFATFGFCFIAVFCDTWTLSYRVTAKNKNNMKNVNNDRVVKVVASSIIRFVAQFLFGCWIGSLFSLVTILLVGSESRGVLALFIAVGVTKGVFVVGNCRGQQRSLIYIAISAATSSHITILSLIHSFIMAIIITGLVRGVLDRRISVISENTYSRVTASLGSAIRDKYFLSPSRDIFSNTVYIEYLPPQRMAVTNNYWFSLAIHQKSWDELSFFDYLAVLIVDFMRYSSKLQKKDDNQTSKALQMALRRMFILQFFDVSPFASDEEVGKKCSKYITKGKIVEGAADSTIGWQYRTVKKSCELIASWQSSKIIKYYPFIPRLLCVLVTLSLFAGLVAGFALSLLFLL